MSIKIERSNELSLRVARCKSCPHKNWDLKNDMCLDCGATREAIMLIWGVPVEEKVYED